MQLVASEASPLHAGEMKSETAFAGIPGELGRNMLHNLAFISFSCLSSDPSPSLPNLSNTAYFVATLRFAACAAISRYGVLIVGLAWAVYKSINSANDWK